MKRNSKSEFVLCIPVLLALGSVYFRSIWLVLASIILIFILVALLPFCRKRENLWLFILCAICSVPINIFLLTEFPQWKYLLYRGSEKSIVYYIVLSEVVFIGTGVEEVLIALIGRRFWRKQYALYIPESD